jgi:hypothetical protein
MPREPKLITIEPYILSELTTELRVNYPETDKADAEIFNNVLKVKIAYKGMLDDLKTQSILRVVKSNIYTKDIGKSKYCYIEVSIFNTKTIYRYTTTAPLDNDYRVITTWTVNKTETIDDKDITYEAVFKE